MNETKKLYQIKRNSQGAVPRHARTKHSLKMAGVLLIFAYLLTILGVHTVWLKMQIDCKYLKLDELKRQNYKLDVQISKLEADVDSLKSYDRIERVLKDSGYDMVVPDEAVYIRIDGQQESIMKAEGEAPRSKSSVD